MPKSAPSRELPAAYEQDTLARNLAALERFDPELAERIRLPCDSSAVKCESGGLRYRWHKRWLDLGLEERVVEGLCGDVAGRSALLLGIGGGELVEPLLCRTTGARLTLWERDPWLLRLFLMRRDVSAALANGRLRIALGIDLLRHIGRPEARVVHPVLELVYGDEIRLLERGPGPRRAMMCAGGLFVEDVRRELERRGFSLWTLEIERLAGEELARSMRYFRPELVVAINHSNGLAEFCAEHGARCLCWEVDPATSVPRKVSGPTDHVSLFTHRRANVELFRQAGFTRVEYLPLATDPEYRTDIELAPDDLEEYGAPFAFVGSSMVANAKRCRARFLDAWEVHGPGDREQGQDIMEGVLLAQRADFSSFLIPELLESTVPGFRAAAIAGPDAEDPALLIGEIAASEKRLTLASNLVSSGLAVWGDEGWTAVAGLDCRGPAGHRTELTKIYNACPLHLDVGRIYQPDIVTMRVFDVLACGRLVLAEHNAELEILFDVGQEVETYRTLGELRAKVLHYTQHPEEAREIARRGQDAVRERHSIAQRLDRMLS